MELFSIYVIAERMEDVKFSEFDFPSLTEIKLFAKKAPKHEAVRMLNTDLLVVVGVIKRDHPCANLIQIAKSVNHPKTNLKNYRKYVESNYGR